MSFIDERVVKMSFDNEKFESGVNNTISSLTRLKESLNFDNEAEALNNLEKSSKSLSFSHLKGAIDDVKTKFSALEIAGITALMNITNRAVDTGVKLVRSMSVDQIMAGWQKLEDKTVSVATLVSQGYDISTVEAQLKRLNWFTDETSYNFTEMVANIAKFTASGQDLEGSVTALEGVANWAALSGQNAQTASHAMYQLSQAMGAGYMRKEDWKSIQNVSMDTDEFRQKALDAGVAVGTLKKNLDGTYQSMVANTKAFSKSQFSEHLTQDAWMTSEVMMKVFNDYSAAVDDIYEYAEAKSITASEAIEELGGSIDAFGLKAFKSAQEARSWTDVVSSVKDAVSTGWMTTFESIFGNYEEQRVLWTDLANSLYDVFAEAGNLRNEMLGEWKLLGGRTDLIEGFTNIFKALGSVINAVKEGFRELFPGVTAKQLAEFTSKFRKFTASLQLSEEALNGVKEVAKTVLIPVRVAVNVISALLKLVPYGIAAIKMGLDSIKSHFANAQAEGNKLLGFFTKMKAGLAQISLQKVSIAALGAVMVAVAVKIAKKLKELLSIFTSTATVMGQVKQGFVTFGRSLKSLGKAFTMNVKLNAIKQLSISIGILAASIFLLSQVDAKQALQSSLILVGVITALGLVFSLLAKLLGKTKAAAGNLAKLGAFAASISISLALLAVSIRILGDMDFNQAQGNVLILLELLGGLTLATVLISKLGKGIRKGSKTIKSLSTSLLLLSVAIRILGNMDPAQAQWNVLTLVELMGALTLMTILLGNLGKVISRGTLTIISLSTAMLLLTVAIRIIGDMEFGQAQWNVLLIIELMSALSLMTVLISAIGKRMARGAITIAALGAAVLALTVAIRILGNIEFGQAQGNVILLLELLGALGLMAVLINVAGKGFAKGVGTILALATAMMLMTLAIRILGNMEFNQAQGNVILLLELLGSISLMSILIGQLGKGVAKASGTIRALATSLLLMSLAVRIIGEMEFGQAQGNVFLLMELMGALGLVTILVSRFSKISLKGIASMIVLAGAVTVLAADLAVLSWLGKDSAMLITAAEALALTMTSFALSAMIANGSVKGAAAMIIMAVAAAAVAATLWGMVELIQDQAMLITAAACLSGTILILATAGLIANGAIAGMVALIGIAAAALIVAGSLALIAHAADDWTEVVAAAGSIVATLTILTVVATLATAAYAGIPALIGIGVGMGIAAVSILIAAAAFDVFAAGVMTLAQAFAVITPLLPMFSTGISMLIKQTTSALVTGANNIAKAAFVLAYGIGSNLISGLIIGIGDGFGLVSDHATGLGGILISSLAKATGVNSPSWMTKLIGMFCGEGLGNGLDESQDGVSTAGANLGQAGLNGLGSKIGGFFNLGQGAGQNFMAGLNSIVGDLPINFGYSKYDETQLQEAADQAFKVYKATMASYQRGGGTDSATIGMVEEAHTAYSNALRELVDYRTEHNVTADSVGTLGDAFNDLIPEIDDTSAALNGGGGGGGGGAKEAVEETVEIIYVMEDAINHLNDRYKNMNKDLSDTDAYKKASDAVMKFSGKLAGLEDGLVDLAIQNGEIIDSMREAWSTYVDEVKKSLGSATDLFSEFAFNGEGTIQKMINNLVTDTASMKAWIDAIEKAVSKGINADLLKEITDKGLTSESLSYLQSIANATSYEIRRLNAAYEDNAMTPEEMAKKQAELLALAQSGEALTMSNTAEGIAAAINDILDNINFQQTYNKYIPEFYEYGKAFANALKQGEFDNLEDAKAIQGLYEALMSDISVWGTPEDEKDQLDDTRNMSQKWLNIMSQFVDDTNALLSDDLDTDPVITIVLDDSVALAKAHNFMSTLENMGFMIDGSVAAINANAVSNAERNRINAKARAEGINGEYDQEHGVYIAYTQNNYSPKALSYYELYRSSEQANRQMERLLANSHK